MGKLIVAGGQKLKGEISVEGAKNAVLPILAATVLNEGLNVIRNCPKLKDVEIMLQILESLGCKVSREDDIVMVDSSTLNSTFITEELAVEMRSSIIFMGPILAKYGKVTISYPGGCVILRAHYGVTSTVTELLSVEPKSLDNTHLYVKVPAGPLGITNAFVWGSGVLSLRSHE